MSQSTALVMLRRSVILTTLFLGKLRLVVLLCVVTVWVLSLFLTVHKVGLQSVIVTYSGHNLFLYSECHWPTLM